MGQTPRKTTSLWQMQIKFKVGMKILQIAVLDADSCQQAKTVVKANPVCYAT